MKRISLLIVLSMFSLNNISWGFDIIDSPSSVPIGGDLIVTVNNYPGESIFSVKIWITNNWGQRIDLNIVLDPTPTGYATIWLPGGEPIHTGYWNFHAQIGVTKADGTFSLRFYNPPDYNERVTIYEPAANQPIAVAGNDMTVTEGQQVYLDGSFSYDPDGTYILYHWEQVDGTPVVLSNLYSATPYFYAPSISTTTETLIFMLTVTDNYLIESEPDMVSVLVRKAGSSGGGGGGGCCIYSDNQNSALDPLILLLVTMALVRVFRRANYPK